MAQNKNMKGCFIMESFNEHFRHFLTECMNNALLQLKTDPIYSDLKQKRVIIHSQIAKKVGFDLSEEYLDLTNMVHSMELNSIFLCGIITHSDICKRFDPSSSEYRKFIKEFLS